MYIDGTMSSIKYYLDADNMLAHTMESPIPHPLLTSLS